MKNLSTIRFLRRRTGIFARDIRGSISVIFALLLLPVTGLTIFSIDYAEFVNAREQLQSELDSALMSGSRNIPGERVDAAENFFKTGSTVNKSDRFAITLNISEEGDDKLVGTADISMNTTLAGLIGMSTLDAVIESETYIQTVAGAPASSAEVSACILLMDPWASQSLTLNSGGTIDAPDCEIHVRSEGNHAAVFNSGVAYDVGKTCVASNTVINNTGGDVPGLETGCETVDDPFAGNMPAPPSTTCQYNNLNYNGGPISMQPGVYCGWVNFNNSPTVTFAPGVYVIKNGGWNVNGGTWTGDGVTFYFDDTSKIQFNSGVEATMTPPETGDYAGIMMYERAGLSTSDFMFNDDKGFDLSGLMYLPSRNVTYNSGGNHRARTMTMIYNKLMFNNAKLSLTSAPLDIAVDGEPETAASTETIYYGRLTR